MSFSFYPEVEEVSVFVNRANKLQKYIESKGFSKLSPVKQELLMHQQLLFIVLSKTYLCRQILSDVADDDDQQKIYDDMFDDLNQMFEQAQEEEE